MSKTTPQDAKDWIASIIESCTSEFHFNSVGTLVELFKVKYPDEKVLKGELVDLLSDKIAEKFPFPKPIHEA